MAVSAEAEIHCVDPEGSGTINILADGSAHSIIIANRKLLYDKYHVGDVTLLLQRLYTEAQGPPASHTPRSVIYYVDRYSTEASNWDNTNVTYTSEATANVVADAIVGLIEDWYDDATRWFTNPYTGTRLPMASPSYLLIAGDDDTIPFYRYDDPSNDEGINYIGGGCLQGWCVDSDTIRPFMPPMRIIYLRTILTPIFTEAQTGKLVILKCG